MKKKLEEILAEQEEVAETVLEEQEENKDEIIEESKDEDEDESKEDDDSEDEDDEELEEGAYPSADFKKDTAIPGPAAKGKGEMPTVDFKKSVATPGNGAKGKGKMPTVDFKGDRDGNTNKKTPVDPESYDKVKPNFDPEVVKQLTKEDISEETQGHIDSLFAGDELSEEFKAKVKEVFEAAVIVTAQKVLAENTEAVVADYQGKLDIVLEVAEQEVEAYKVELNEKSDRYFDYVVEQWMERNEVAVKSNIKTELTESFIDGLQKLFTEHYIEVPESKVDLVEEMVKEQNALKATNEQLLQDNLKLVSDKKNVLKSFMIKEHAKDLSDSDKEKLSALVEHISFNDEDSFKGKLEEITESYFSPKEVIIESTLENDEPIEIVEEEVKEVDTKSDMQKMADKMARFLKK